MVDLSSWISGILKTSRERDILEDVRAAEALRRIYDRPYSAVFLTPGGVELAAQMVRVESDNSATPSESTAGAAPVRKVVVYGILSHPTLPDTNMREGYTMIYEGDEYHCVDVITTIGQVQGIWEVTG
jgi:hypothetical protein